MSESHGPGIAIVLALVAGAVGTAEEQPPAVSRPAGTVEFEGHEYLLVDDVEELSWHSAARQCAAWDGHLVVINNEAESAFVSKLCDGRYMYLGASDAESEGNWAWVDGSEWSFTNWMEGQPNNYGDTEDFLATYDDGEWVDVDAEGGGFWMPTGYICEWDR